MLVFLGMSSVDSRVGFPGPLRWAEIHMAHPFNGRSINVMASSFDGHSSSALDDVEV